MTVGTLDDLPEFEMTARSSGEKLSLARSLSDFSGVASLLVHHEILLPGRRASRPHFHSEKEEIFLVLSGEPSVWVDGETRQLQAGDFVGFNRLRGQAHMLLNASDAPAVILSIGTNPENDEITFVDGPDL